MIIGCVKEIKKYENRVGLTPAGAAELVLKGHTVFIEKSAGEGSGFEDHEYQTAGAKIINTAAECWEKVQMIIKVKEPLDTEFKYFRPGLIIYTYFHLAPEAALTKALLDNKVTAIAFETVELADGSLPLLAPMSEVAGRMSIQVGARLLEKIAGGSGKLLGGVPGVEAGKVVIVGGGVVGTQAAKMAVGLGAEVTILDVSKKRLGQIDDLFGGRVKTLISNHANLSSAIKEADLLVGGVLIPGAAAPKVVKTEMVKSMKKGSVVVDVAIDQGGCIETIDRITYHDNPTYVAHGVVHYSVANMPGAVPRTSTLALTSVTLPYAVRLAADWKKAILADPALAKGVNTHDGKLTNKAVADAQGIELSVLKL